MSSTGGESLLSSDDDANWIKDNIDLISAPKKQQSRGRRAAVRRDKVTLLFRLFRDPTFLILPFDELDIFSKFGAEAGQCQAFRFQTSVFFSQF